MAYLRELTRSFKSEVKAVLASDPTLAKEVEYDLKMYEKEVQAQLKAEQLKAEQAR